MRGLLLLLILGLVSSIGPGHGQEPDGREVPAEAVNDPLTVSQARFVLGNTLWTLVHEMAHALIAELEINVLGQEEYAADRIASIALLLGTLDDTHGADEVNLLADAAEAWRLEWILDQQHGEPTPYWDNHPLDIQRYYNIVCLIHAHNPELIDQRPALTLPGQRALSCDDYEYEQAASSVRQLVEIYGKGSKENGRAIAVVYELPTRERHVPLAALVRESGIAEHVAMQTTAMFKLPHTIRIVFGSCLGDASAFWREEIREIVICYDLLERFVYLHKARSCLAGKSADSAAAQSCLSESQL